jgi:hypothetical protein
MATLDEIEGGETPGHSLPLHHDMEGETVKSSGRRSILVSVMVVLLVVGAIVGLSIGIATSKESGSTTASSAASHSRPNINENGGFITAPQEEEEPKEVTESTTSTPVFSDSETEATISPRLASIIDFLVSQGVSQRSELETPKSPSNIAAKWIANEDPMMLSVPEPLTTEVLRNSTIADEEIFVNRYLLALIYFATGGNKWSNSFNFLSAKSICEWFEVINGVPEGVGCTPDGRVVVLFLSKSKKQ